MARLTRTVAVLSSLTLASVLLASCGSSGAVADARRACVNVHQALTLEAKSESPNVSVAQRAALQQRALHRLLSATPDAAAATSIDGSWNALMTTVNEAERVPLVHLVPALTRLCQVADSSTPYL